MGSRATGWLLVIVQFALLAVLVVLPGRSDWPTPSWLEAVAYAIAAVGLILAAVAALRLGSSLTPSPIPRRGGSLVVTGLYGWVRHPIYSGALLFVVGVTLRSGSWAVAAVGVILVVFFAAKARLEERHLVAVHPGYGEYAKVTPRFVPRLRRRGRPASAR